MLAFASAIDQFLEGDLFALFPGMRKYRIRRYFIVANDVLGQAELRQRCCIPKDALFGRYLRTQMKARGKVDAKTPQSNEAVGYIRQWCRERSGINFLEPFTRAKLWRPERRVGGKLGARCGVFRQACART
jgi:hypothetical protein